MAVIPTFSPSIELVDLVAVVGRQVDAIVVSDDASPCTSDGVLRDVASLPNVMTLRHRVNAGIARGLNEGLQFARRAGAPWLLTLDQDTAISDTYVDELVGIAAQRCASGERLGALGAEFVEDSSGPMRYPSSTVGGLPVTEEVIQTGTLWRVDALEQVGGFDESLGMDAVDAAACLALRAAGYTIGLAHGLRIDHRIGETKRVLVAGRPVMVTGHSPARRTSMLRNRLRLFPGEFAQSPRHAVRTIRRVTVNQALGLMIEQDRWAKAKGTARALWPRRGR